MTSTIYDFISDESVREQQIFIAYLYNIADLDYYQNNNSLHRSSRFITSLRLALHFKKTEKPVSIL